MTITREASIELMKKGNKVYINLKEVGSAFGCVKETIIRAYKEVITKNAACISEVHVLNQKDIYVTIKVLNEIRSELYRLTCLSCFTVEATKSIFDELYVEQGILNAGESNLVELPQSYKQHYRKGKIQLIDSMQAAVEFGVIPSQIYMSLNLMKEEYGLKEDINFFVGKNPIIFEGKNYDRPYFTHLGLISIAMKLIATNHYDYRRVVNGFVKCINERFILTSPKNSKFEYRDYDAMLGSYYKKYCRKAYLSVQDEVDLKDLLQRFAALC